LSYTVQLVYGIPGGGAQQLDFIQLTWTDSTDPNAASVNVYRSLVSGGPYTILATGIPMGVQMYQDFAVTPRVTYYYVTTEVNNVGAESGFTSPQALATATPQ